jgi:hypothetical protein
MVPNLARLFVSEPMGSDDGSSGPREVLCARKALTWQRLRAAKQLFGLACGHVNDSTRRDH